MMGPQMARYSPQVHPIYIHLQGFLASLLIIRPRFWLWRVFGLTIHTLVALASCSGFPCSVLPFCLFTLWAFVHFVILPHFLSTPPWFWGCLP